MSECTDCIDRETNSFYEFICYTNLYNRRIHIISEFMYDMQKNTRIHVIYEFVYNTKWSSNSRIWIRINTHTILDVTIHWFNWWRSHDIKWHGNGFQNKMLGMSLLWSWNTESFQLLWNSHSLTHLDTKVMITFRSISYLTCRIEP